MQRLPILDYASAEVWEKMWEEDSAPFWHNPNVHSKLVKHYSEWTAHRQTALRLFLPLCGKSVDMLWLAAQGHTVVGVELVEKAVREFFTENKLEYEIRVEKPCLATEPTLKAYYSTNKEGRDITIFVCDIFQFLKSQPKEKFDGIWDRGSLVAICLTKGKRVRSYVQGLLAMLAPEGCYFTETCRYDTSENEGSNMILVNVTEEEMNELFGGSCNLRQVDTKTFDEDLKATGRPVMAHEMVYHMITFK